MKFPKVLRLSLPLLAVVAALALVGQGTPQPASATTCIQLWSGTDGAGNPGIACADDPLVTYTSNSAGTPRQAMVGVGYPSDPCLIGDYLGGSSSQNVTTHSQSDTWVDFETTFYLPPGFTNPVLDLEVYVDDVADVYLNGTQLADDLCKAPNGPQLVYTVSTTDPAQFGPGVNTLRFEVVNNPWSCAHSPTGRGGGGDAMGLEFEGTVCLTAGPTPSPPGPSPVGGLVELAGDASDPAADISDSSARDYTPPLAAAVAAGAIALAAGGWYARRRWLR